MAADFGDQRRIDATAIEIIEGGVVEDIVLIAASEQRQEVQPGLGGRGAEIGELRPADLGRMEIGARMPGAGIVDGDCRLALERKNAAVSFLVGI